MYLAGRWRCRSLGRRMGPALPEASAVGEVGGDGTTVGGDDDLL
jgi:hypothetical protein